MKCCAAGLFTVVVASKCSGEKQGLTCICFAFAQRLHPNHDVPRNTYTKYDRGWLMFFKPAQSGANVGVARAEFIRFMDVCNRPMDRLTSAPPPHPHPVASSCNYPPAAAGGITSANYPPVWGPPPFQQGYPGWQVHPATAPPPAPPGGFIPPPGYSPGGSGATTPGRPSNDDNQVCWLGQCESCCAHALPH